MKRIRIPADVDRDDHLLAGLTARQLAVVAVAAVICWSVYAATSSFLPPVFIAVFCTPIALVAAALVVGRLDGLHGTGLAAAATRHLLRPHAHVLAPGGVETAPGAQKRIVPLSLSPESFSDDGVIGCSDGDVLLCTASSVAFRLRTDTEQEALTGAFGRFLNGLTEPLQILIHVERVDLAETARELEHSAPRLPHPALQEAAREHATFLQSLSARADVLRREVVLVFRTRPGSPGDVGRRMDDAVDALAAAGIRVQPLTARNAAAFINRAADRSCRVNSNAQSIPDDIVRGVRP